MNKSNFVKIIAVISMAFAGIGLVGGGFVFSRASDKGQANQVVNDIKSYREVRNKVWFSQALVKHFPTEIPVDAQNVRFVSSFGYMQAGNILQLRLKQPQAKIAALLAEYEKVALSKYQGGNSNEHVNQPNGVPTTFFHTSDDSSNNSFPFNYKILVLGVSDKGSKDFKWNHGNSYGVAINTQGSEIVYWAEEW
jgi:hypothetical protein